MPQLGKVLIGVGIFIVLAGVLVYFFGDKLGWIGNLPGDLHTKGKNVSFHFPIVTMIIVSVILTIIVNVVIRLFK